MGRQSQRNPEFSINITDEWLALSKGLKQFDKELRAELHKELRKAAKPLVKVARDAIREEYPSGGGMGATMAAPMSTGRNGKKQGTAIVPVVLTGRYPGVGVRIRGVNAKTAELFGFVRHPVHARLGEKDKWKWPEKPQFVPHLQGVIRTRILGQRDQVTPHIAAAIERTAQKVINKAGVGK